MKNVKITVEWANEVCIFEIDPQTADVQLDLVDPRLGTPTLTAKGKFLSWTAWPSKGIQPPTQEKD